MITPPSTTDATPTEPGAFYEGQHERFTTPTQYEKPQTVSSYFNDTDYSANTGLHTPAMSPNTPLPSPQNLFHHQRPNNSYAVRSWDTQSSPPQAYPPMRYSSRIEDVSIVSEKGPGFTPLDQRAPGSQRVVRSQYITAPQDAAWILGTGKH